MTTKLGAIYLMHYLPASTTVGELLVAGYEKNLASTLGYTNADRAYADAVGGADKGFFTSLGHSRGTLVQTNANDILSSRGYSNGNIEYRGVGGLCRKMTIQSRQQRLSVILLIMTIFNSAILLMIWSRCLSEEIQAH